MRTLAAQIARSLPTAHSLRTDGDLLCGFLTLGTEDDFAELVRRHGPLVWGVCRRTLPDAADAEDAFQATFLVLVRRGQKLTTYPTIGPWLHKVAAWTARNVRRRNARRYAKQSALPDQVPAAPVDSDLALDIDAALLALPEKFRSPIVLCHLLGYSRVEAAERLGCAEGTLSAWLSRGLAKLRNQFGGLDPAKVLSVAAVAAPSVLTASAVRAAAASRLAVSTAVSSTVSQVVEGVIRMFWIQKATAASAAVAVVFALGVGVGLTGRQVEGTADGQEKGAAVAPGQTPKADALAADLDKMIVEYERKLHAAASVHEEAMKGVEYLKEKIKLLESKGGASKAQILDDMITLSRFLENVDRAAAEQKAFKDTLDRLKAIKTEVQKTDKPKPEKATPDPKNLALPDIDEQRARLRIELQRLSVLRDSVARELKALTEQANKLQDEFDSLNAKRAELEKPAAMAKRSGHLELSVRGTAPKYEFTLREVDAAGKVVLVVRIEDTTGDATMLARLLARTRADATAPREMRVVAAPPTSLGMGPHAALKACETAGYPKVKFTGYVPAGGFTRELKENEKGEVPGYRNYDGAEKTPADLMKEIELGMRTF